ncbi:hypothetical protein [Nonomuraea sp. 10N515B]|uniref:hypothetical protein n=1 Tax=Nonomuraea sp. 10N515B TaxID=3457422 RepID=UPI003FCE1B88
MPKFKTATGALAVSIAMSAAAVTLASTAYAGGAPPQPKGQPVKEQPVVSHAKPKIHHHHYSYHHRQKQKARLWIHNNNHQDEKQDTRQDQDQAHAQVEKQISDNESYSTNKLFAPIADGS